jgi:hypothetical protein
MIRRFNFIEEFPEKLAQFTGTHGRPLGYIIREDEIPLVADHPLFGELGAYNIQVSEINFGRCQGKPASTSTTHSDISKARNAKTIK